MTSNIGSHLIQEGMERMTEDNRDALSGQIRDQVFDLLKKSIRPEFLNRVDEIIMFRTLSMNEIIRVVDIQMDLVSRMLEKNGITLKVTKAAAALIARLGFDPQYGARPIKRVIQKEVLNELSGMILTGKLDRDSEIVIGEKGGKLIFGNG